MTRTHDPILPGSTLGVLGGGQLGRMFAQQAHRMGYRVHVFAPEGECPAETTCDKFFCAEYTDHDRVAAFAQSVDVVTLEFENVPAQTVDVADRYVPVHPNGRVMRMAQNRLAEKRALAEAGLPVTPFRAVNSDEDLAAARVELGRSVILKTAAWGYDGKGQRRIKDDAEARQAWHEMGEQELICEQEIPYEMEISAIAARNVQGDMAHFELFENRHRNHVLDITVCPARIPEKVREEAIRVTREVMTALEVIGVLCVEFFVSADQGLMINEIAPRPHNSGHLTIDAHVTSQFEQQVRAICGLPLGSTRMLQPAAMANVLGDLWDQGTPPWHKALSCGEVKLHLYGKASARPGRKMGHLTATAHTVEEAERMVRRARAAVESVGDRETAETASAKA